MTKTIRQYDSAHLQDLDIQDHEILYLVTQNRRWHGEIKIRDLAKTLRQLNQLDKLITLLTEQT